MNGLKRKDMIKFIATDLDGTLLDGARSLPDETFRIIDELHARGILFAPSSGRQYANLSKFFAPVQDKVLFICENGALVKYRGETLYLNPIGEELLKETLDEIRAIPRLLPVLCGENSAYIEDKREPFRTLSVDAYTNCSEVESLDNVIGKEPVCKIAVYDELSSEHCIRVLPPRLPKLRTILSGADWCDVSAPDASKGEAIRFIRAHFQLRREECVAFGDHMNDYEMLLECGRAYVTENAYPPLKDLIGQTVPANTEYGVLKKIKQILAEEVS